MRTRISTAFGHRFLRFIRVHPRSSASYLRNRFRRFLPFFRISGRRQALILALAFLLLLEIQATIGASVSFADGNPPDVWVPDGAPIRIVIPKINVDSPITPVGLVKKKRRYEWATVKKGVAWHNLSAIPGQTGNMTLSGHNGSRGNKVFRKLHKLHVGDTFLIFSKDHVFEYVITDRIITRELFQSKKKKARNARWIGDFPDERVTLITCYPWWTNTHRLILVAHPVKTVDLNEEKTYNTFLIW